PGPRGRQDPRQRRGRRDLPRDGHARDRAAAADPDPERRARPIEVAAACPTGARRTSSPGTPRCARRLQPALAPPVRLQVAEAALGVALSQVELAHVLVVAQLVAAAL